MKIYVIGCSKKKLDHPAKASEMYSPSTLFGKCLDYANQESDYQNDGKIVILSALYGAITPEKEIEPYDKTVGDLSVSDRKEWDESNIEIISRIAPKITIIWLAGKSYMPKNGLPSNWKCEFPMNGMGIGKRLQFLKKSVDWHHEQSVVFDRARESASALPSQRDLADNQMLLFGDNDDIENQRWDALNEAIAIHPRIFCVENYIAVFVELTGREKYLKHIEKTGLCNIARRVDVKQKKSFSTNDIFYYQAREKRDTRFYELLVRWSYYTGEPWAVYLNDHSFIQAYTTEAEARWVASLMNGTMRFEGRDDLFKYSVVEFKEVKKSEIPDSWDNAHYDDYDDDSFVDFTDLNSLK